MIKMASNCKRNSAVDSLQILHPYSSHQAITQAVTRGDTSSAAEASNSQEFHIPTNREKNNLDDSPRGKDEQAHTPYSLKNLLNLSDGLVH